MSDPTLFEEETRPTFRDPIYRLPRNNRPIETIPTQPYLSARRADPQTSVQAAAQLTPGRTEALILEAFKCEGGPYALTADQLCALTPLAGMHKPTVVSAISRLGRSGLLVDSGVRRKSNRGRDQIVWRLA
jgi:hypothetical protein